MEIKYRKCAECNISKALKKSFHKNHHNTLGYSYFCKDCSYIQGWLNRKPVSVDHVVRKKDFNKNMYVFNWMEEDALV